MSSCRQGISGHKACKFSSQQCASIRREDITDIRVSRTAWMSKSKAEKERDEFELQSIAMESSNDDIESPSNERIGLLPHQMPSSSGTDDHSVPAFRTHWK